MVVYPRILSLCSGYGGLDLGIEIATGGKAVCYVEREAYAAANLVARMEDKTLDQAPIWDDLRTFGGAAWRGAVDCITAGYPCQPFSLAGNRRGTADERHLWPDVRRIVSEVRPRFCFFENVANHLNMGFDTVSRELQEMGYSVAAALVTASEVGAPHKRERLFILANGNGRGRETEWGKGVQHGKRKARRDNFDGRSGEKLAHTESKCRRAVQGRDIQPHGGRESADGCKELVHTESERAGLWEWHAACGKEQEHTRPVVVRGLFPPGQDPDDPRWPKWPWPAFEPGFRRNSYGASKWNDRLRLCGNGVVPLAAAYAFGILCHDLGVHRNTI